MNFSFFSKESFLQILATTHFEVLFQHLLQDLFSTATDPQEIPPAKRTS